MPKATLDVTFLPAVLKVFESYSYSVLAARTGIARNPERLKPKNVTMLNSSPAIIICFHFPKNTTQQIFFNVVCIVHHVQITIY
jgi:hypothetical protein